MFGEQNGARVREVCMNCANLKTPPFEKDDTGAYGLLFLYHMKYATYMLEIFSCFFCSLM